MGLNFTEWVNFTLPENESILGIQKHRHPSKHSLVILKIFPTKIYSVNQSMEILRKLFCEEHKETLMVHDTQMLLTSYSKLS